MSVRCRVLQKLLQTAPMCEVDSRIFSSKHRHYHSHGKQSHKSIRSDRNLDISSAGEHRKKSNTGDKVKISLPKIIIEEFDAAVMMIVLQYIHTGSCYIVTSHLPNLIAAADRFDLPELREACLKALPSAISLDTIIDMLNSMEHFIQYKSVKSLLQKLLEFVDRNIKDVLGLSTFCNLSEHVLQLVFARDLDIDEIIKFKSAILWGRHYCTNHEGKDLKTVLQQLVNKIQFHLIKPRDLMQIVYRTGVVPDHKLILALAFQADPRSVEGMKGAPVLEHTV